MPLQTARVDVNVERIQTRTNFVCPCPCYILTGSLFVCTCEAVASAKVIYSLATDEAMERTGDWEVKEWKEGEAKQVV